MECVAIILDATFKICGMPNATYGIFYNMNANSGYTYSASLPVTWAKTASGFTVYLPNDKTFDYVAICLI